MTEGPGTDSRDVRVTLQMFFRMLNSVEHFLGSTPVEFMIAIAHREILSARARIRYPVYMLVKIAGIQVLGIKFRLLRLKILTATDKE
ncbi:hypothetical protein ACJ72_03644 [Emergomyces africanus]|uniref:Uncharacterized protein n=1 Tax=Emergomyces africanus TaxID=1955775 RepID=A0A1B7NZ09_9EURO|nr:hypothetical protein ACJ72_03644 [Emergomyces africanus]